MNSFFFLKEEFISILKTMKRSKTTKASEINSEAFTKYNFLNSNNKRKEK